MKRYSKMFLSTLFLSAALVFMYGSASYVRAAFQDAEEEEYSEEYEEQYNALEAANKETDPVKSAGLLIEFIQKYPDSKLVPYAESSYQNLFARCSQEKKFQELETIAEQWKKIKPGDKLATALIANAAEALGHDEKYVQSMEEIYKQDPKVEYASALAQTYRKMKNDAKYIEWIEIVLKAPEYESNFRLRYELMNEYISKKNNAKTMEYAQATLKAADLVKDTSADTVKDLTLVRLNVNRIIGSMLFDDGKFADAITSFQKALKAEKYAEGYYWIGMCLWKQNNVDNAILAFAKAQLYGEKGSAADKEIAGKAKDRMEQLYKALHNNTTVGIEKQYRKAQELADDDLAKPL